MEPFAASPSDFALAIIAAGTIAFVAHRKGLLSLSGAIAALLLGPAIVSTGGWWLGVLLVAFFASSSLLPGTDDAGPSRDWRQVLANGAPALFLSGLGMAGWRDALLVGAATTIAAAAADTWATELGRAFGGSPWSIRTWTQVPSGTSGAVSMAGLIASLAGATFVAALALVLDSTAHVEGLSGSGMAVAIALGGMIGSVVDSLLGATVQARFRCDLCGRITETGGVDTEGHPLTHAGGAAWLSNSMVNLTATLAAGLAAVPIYLLTS